MTKHYKIPKEFDRLPELAEELVEDLIDAAVDFGAGGENARTTYDLNQAAEKLYNFLASQLRG